MHKVRLARYKDSTISRCSCGERTVMRKGPNQVQAAKIDAQAHIERTRQEDQLEVESYLDWI